MTGARRRVLDAALALFAEHGVNGTSLQAIADALGVTKAAVFHQFRSKDEIVLAVLGDVAAQLWQVVEGAEAAPRRAEQVAHVWGGLVDVVVDHGLATAVLRGDPAVVALLATDEGLADLVGRLTALLLGPAPGTRQRVLVSVLANGLLQARHDPALADLPDDVLREELRAVVLPAVG